MKKRLTLLYFILFISCIETWAQMQSVCFIVKDIKNPTNYNFEITNSKSKNIIKLKTNNQGKTCTWLASNQEYNLFFNKKKYLHFKVYPQRETIIQIFTNSVELTKSSNINWGKLNLSVQTSERKYVDNELVTLIDKETKLQYIAKTDSLGKAQIRLPIGSKFELKYTNAPDYEEVNIPDKLNADVELLSIFEGSKANTIHPSRKNCLFTMSYIDLENKPSYNECFIVKSKKTKLQYKAYTNKKGIAQLLVPIGDTYTVSTSFLENYATPTVPDSAGLYEMIVEVNYLSTNTIRNEKNKRAAELARRDSIYQKSKTLRNSIERPATILKADIIKRTQQVLDSLKKDSNILLKNKHVPAAIFQRMSSQWKHKVVVTDLTCSMDKYSEDILLWHNLQLNKDEQNDYLFFNDGDGKPESQKTDGKTGGIHHVKSQSIDSIIKCIQLTRKLSPNCSGDGPENDLEAVLEGVKYINQTNKLILIADNESDVRDMSLLKKITIPIHIILCGVSENINEDYLEIAYHTKGSLHTLNEDITNFNNLKEGEIIQINKKKYKLLYGKFVRLQ